MAHRVDVVEKELAGRREEVSFYEKEALAGDTKLQEVRKLLEDTIFPIIEILQCNSGKVYDVPMRENLRMVNITPEVAREALRKSQTVYAHIIGISTEVNRRRKG